MRAAGGWGENLPDEAEAAKMTAAAKTTKAVAVAVVVAVLVRHTIVRSIRRCPTVIANANAPAGPDACTETLTAVGCLSPLAVIPVRSPPPTLHLPLLHVSTQRLRHVQPLPPISTASAARLINRRNAAVDRRLRRRTNERQRVDGRARAAVTLQT